MVVAKVQRDVGQLLLDVTNDFALGCCRERVASFRQDLYHIFCEITSRVVAIMLAGENERTLYTACTNLLLAIEWLFPNVVN